MTEQNKTFAEIAKAAIEQTVPQQNTIIPKITLSKKTHLKMVALILESRIASLHDPRQYGQIVSKSLKENFDIDAPSLTVTPKKYLTSITTRIIMSRQTWMIANI